MVLQCLKQQREEGWTALHNFYTIFAESEFAADEIVTMGEQVNIDEEVSI